MTRTQSASQTYDVLYCSTNGRYLADKTAKMNRTRQIMQKDEVDAANESVETYIDDVCNELWFSLVFERATEILVHERLGNLGQKLDVRGASL